MNKEPSFKNYKEKQQYYKNKSKECTWFYDSEKREKGNKVVKGRPYIKEVNHE